MEINLTTGTDWLPRMVLMTGFIPRKHGNDWRIRKTKIKFSSSSRIQVWKYILRITKKWRNIDIRMSERMWEKANKQHLSHCSLPTRWWESSSGHDVQIMHKPFMYARKRARTVFGQDSGRKTFSRKRKMAISILWPKQVMPKNDRKEKNVSLSQRRCEKWNVRCGEGSRYFRLSLLCFCLCSHMFIYDFTIYALGSSSSPFVPFNAVCGAIAF